MTNGETGSVAPLNLSASVGKDGVNDPVDVAQVRQRLIVLGYHWLLPGGTVDETLIPTIQLFQSIKSGVNKITGDGRVDAGGSTQRWLDAVNAPRWQQMPPGSPAEGFHNAELVDQPLDHHDFGTSWMAETVSVAAGLYRDDHLTHAAGAALLTMNDVSLERGGPTPSHGTHQTGLACDLRLPNRNGTTGGLTHRSSAYDRSAMRAMLKAVKASPLTKRILFNDPDLIGEGLCQRAPGHDNHVHFEIRPPARQSILAPG